MLDDINLLGQHRRAHMLHKSLDSICPIIVGAVMRFCGPMPATKGLLALTDK